jgi:hypothetical protein
MQRPARRVLATAVTATLLGWAFAPQLAHADKDPGKKDNMVFATLSGFNEVHFSGGPPATLRSAISTPATGSFQAKIDDLHQTIDYRLTYNGLTGAVTQSHIHLGLRHSAGGITVWLCQTAGTPAPASVAAATPMCPADGSVTGTITPAQVLPITAQGLDAGQFEELVQAIRAGATYANVHSSAFPPGEIRGQIQSGKKPKD